jgi:4'-phosphopantetheinyl transferase
LSGGSPGGGSSVAAGTAYVWHLSTDTVAPEVATAWLSLLDAHEVDRHARLVFGADRDAYLGAHALLRCALALYGGVAPGAWRFVRRRGEKPVAAPGLPPLRFSLSHTRGMAACAVAVDLDVGVDAEPLARGCDETVAAIALSRRERRAVADAAPHARARELLARWTLKEAYLKTLGTGLDRLGSPDELQRIGFDVDGCAVTPRIEDLAGEERSWRFATVTTPAHVVSAAARSRGATADRIVMRSADGAMNALRAPHLARCC